MEDKVSSKPRIAARAKNKQTADICTDSKNPKNTDRILKKSAVYPIPSKRFIFMKHNTNTQTNKVKVKLFKPKTDGKYNRFILFKAKFSKAEYCNSKIKNIKMVFFENSANLFL